ncbi:hypothetical protein [Spongiactinospora rosea]|uniref:hypothetical protein n=1 Tax=Spongiactinospora rosea TaxID=2248750 RepID=UPI0013148B33|nr:hypothetical protein [Spongiactinospora rosea]
MTSRATASTTCPATAARGFSGPPGAFVPPGTGCLVGSARTPLSSGAPPRTACPAVGAPDVRGPLFVLPGSGRLSAATAGIGCLVSPAGGVIAGTACPAMAAPGFWGPLGAFVPPGSGCLSTTGCLVSLVSGVIAEAARPTVAGPGFWGPLFVLPGSGRLSGAIAGAGWLGCLG